MFNFNDENLTEERIMEIAKIDDLPPLRVAINANGYRQSVGFWGKVSIKDGECSAAEMKVIRVLIQQAKASKGVVGVRSLYESVRLTGRFEGKVGVMEELKGKIIPHLDDLSVTCLLGDKVYVNPTLVIGDMDWIDEVVANDEEINLPTIRNVKDSEALIAELKQIKNTVNRLLRTLTGK